MDPVLEGMLRWGVRARELECPGSQEDQGRRYSRNLDRLLDYRQAYVCMKERQREIITME